MTQILLLCGPPGSGKSAQARQRYVTWLQGHMDDPRAADRALFLVPSAEHRQETSLALLDAGLPGLYDPRLFTFLSLAEAVLEANHKPARRLSRAQRELLLTDVVQKLYPDGVAGGLGPVANLPGFVVGLGRLIMELKQSRVSADQWPELAEKAGLGDHPVTPVLHAVYLAYQQHLQMVGLHDEPGLLWELHDLLQDGKQKPLESLKLLLVDGFDEFTRAQLDILRLLAEGAEGVVITLCLEEDGDSFPLAQATQGELLGLWPEAQVKWLQGPDEIPDERVTIIGAPGPLAEVREVARAIKSRLQAPGGDPGDHAVVVRSLDNYETVLREVFRAYGLPVEMPRGPLLGQSPAVQVVLDVLQVLAKDFRRDDVVQLLNSTYVHECKLQEGSGTPPLSAQAFERVAREAQVIGGRDHWANQLALMQERLQAEYQVADSGQTEDTEGNRVRDVSLINQLRDQCEQAQTLFTRLKKLLEPLENANSAKAAVQALTQVLQDLGVVKRAESVPAGGKQQDLDRDLIARDRAALLRLFALLREYGEATDVLGTTAPPATESFLRDLQAFVSATVATERLPRETDWGGAVRVLAADQVAGHRFRHVYVLGLREGEFPRQIGPDAFFDEGARQSIQCNGQPVLTTRERQRAREATHFRRAVGAASETLTLTWPTSDARGAQQLRSSLLEDLLETHPGWAKQQKLVNRSQVIASPAQAASQEELLAAMCRQTKPGGIKTLLGDLLNADGLDSLLDRIGVEAGRQSAAAPDAHDGVMGDAEIRKLLAGPLFGPDHAFSASQFDTYAQCPMRFFLERVLHLQELEDPDEDLQAKDLGNLMHRVLANFFREIPADKKTTPLSESDLKTEQARMAQCLDTVWGETTTLGLLSHKALADVLRDQVLRDLLAVLRHEVKVQQGPPKGPQEYVRDCELPYETHLAENDLKVVGRIDRVDQVIGGGVKVYDYKSGDGPAETQVRQGLATQLPLYVQGLKALDGYKNTDVESCGYYRVRGRAHLKKVPSKSGLETVVQSCLDAIKAGVKRLRAGIFAPLPADRCPAYCAYRTICRYSRTRMEAKAAVAASEGALSATGGENNG